MALPPSEGDSYLDRVQHANSVMFLGVRILLFLTYKMFKFSVWYILELLTRSTGCVFVTFPIQHLPVKLYPIFMKLSVSVFAA